MPRKRKRVRPAGARKRGRFMQPSVEVTHVQCECGGRYLRPGTARGAASYRAHIATQRHWRAENAALAQRVADQAPLGGGGARTGDVGSSAAVQEIALLRAVNEDLEARLESLGPVLETLLAVRDGLQRGVEPPHAPAIQILLEHHGLC